MLYVYRIEWQTSSFALKPFGDSPRINAHNRVDIDVWSCHTTLGYA